MAFERGHALVIGVGSYKNAPHNNVPITMNDAQGVRDVLCNAALCGYLPERVALLHDKTADKASILAALAVLEGVAEDHTVLLFYCGHGSYGTDGAYYLTTHDCRFDGARVVAGTGISEAELLDSLRQIKAKRLILLFNACHSGEISPNLGPEEKAPALESETLPETAVDALLSTGEGRVIITASRPEQKSWIGSGKLTIFGKALVDGLSGKGTVNNRGFVGAFDLYEHVYETVKEAAAGLNQVQEPELTVLRGVGPFAVALYKGASSLGAFDESETAMAGAAVRRVTPEKSRRRYDAVIKNITASGERSVAAETIIGSTIVTGDKNVVQKGKYNIKIDNAQNPVIGDNAQVTQSFSSVNTGSGDYVGRDQNIGGDVVKGDQVGGDKIDVGDISGGTVGIGRGAQVTSVQGLSGAEIAALFAPLTQAIQQAPAEKRAEAMKLEQELQDEVAKGEEADDGRMAKLLDGLLSLVPGAVGAAVSVFATPVLGALAGPVTKWVLEKFIG